MIQQRKKDYLQRLIEEFFAKLQQLDNEKQKLTIDEQKAILGECFRFFEEEFLLKKSDSLTYIIEHVDRIELLEQYARMLMTEYELNDIKNSGSLLKALDIVEYLEKTDNVYSWDRTILKEDILRYLNDTER